ncbi:uncharacterized protein [Lolium perenne]|uniref:uncharacterized protein n=1 Tax=Lolium perenne TaxID=4522 RepID=UPI0021F67515|nr:uncharacterized protein LOC127309144 [Lolium perenne]
MAYPSVSPPTGAGADAASGCRASKLSCLCSPTNHPGSFRCSRHRTPRARPLPSSVFVRASQKQAAVPGMMKSGGGGVAGSIRATSNCRPVLRSHLQRLLASPPPSSGGRCREFKPRLSRLGRLAAASS